MSYETPNEELHAIIRRHKLGRRDVARLVERNIAATGQCYSVNNWLSDTTSSNYRPMPAGVLSLLKLRLASLTESERRRLEGPVDRDAIMVEVRSHRKAGR